MKSLGYIVLLLTGFFVVVNISFAQLSDIKLNSGEKATNYTIQKGTELPAKLVTKIDSTTSTRGDKVEFKLARHYIVDDEIILLQNTTFYGTITELSRDSIAGESYTLKVAIHNAINPFGRTFQIEGHTDFDFTKPIKKKGGILSIFGFRRDNSDLFEERTKTTGGKKISDAPLIVPEDTTVNIIVDTDTPITLKKRM